jgi:UDP-glucose 4-epimerase
MRYLVTGGTGFIGSHLIHLLLDQGCRVGVLIRPTSSLWRIQDSLDRLHVIPGNLTTIDQAARGIKAFAPDVIFHLGWHGVDGRYRDDPSQLEQNLHGSLKLLEIAHDSGCQCWVGLGSQAEYGPYDHILTEELPPRPRTMYGIVKLCLGLLSGKLCELYGIRFVWLRLLAAYGSMDDRNHMIPYVILSLLRGQKPALTRGEQRWDYLHVTDVVRAMSKIADSPGVQGVFNLCSGKAHPVRTIVERIRDLVDPRLSLDFGEIPYGPDQRMVLEADVSHLQGVTGWVPHVPLDEGLKATVDWYRNHEGL